MKITTTTTYSFADNDPPWRRDIEHAFNRVGDLAIELRVVPENVKDRKPERIAFNSVINGHWADGDVEILKKYAQTVVERARTKYSAPKMAAAPWKEGVVQAVDNLEDVVTRFAQWFHEQKL